MTDAYPSPEYIEHITFEGRDCVVLSPEEYENVYRSLAAAEAELARLKDQKPVMCVPTNIAEDCAHIAARGQHGTALEVARRYSQPFYAATVAASAEVPDGYAVLRIDDLKTLTMLVKQSDRRERLDDLLMGSPCGKNDAEKLRIGNALADAVINLNLGWNDHLPYEALAERLDLCRRLAIDIRAAAQRGEGKP